MVSHPPTHPHLSLLQRALIGPVYDDHFPYFPILQMLSVTRID